MKENTFFQKNLNIRKAKYEKEKKKENQPAGCSYVALKITRHLVYDFFASYHFHEMQKCRVRISIVIIV